MPYMLMVKNPGKCFRIHKRIRIATKIESQDEITHSVRQKDGHTRAHALAVGVSGLVVRVSDS